MKPEQQEFIVWSVTRADLANALRDEDDNEPEWPYKLTDVEMELLACKMVEYLEMPMGLYWDALRDSAAGLFDDEVEARV